MTESSSSDAVVPQAFADRAMASIMYLHRELAAEKDRAVWLYRTLLERDQALAELWAYVHALEQHAGLAAPVSVAAEQGQTQAASAEPQTLEGMAALAEAAADELERVSVPEPKAAVRATAPPLREEAAGAARAAPPPASSDGWKVW